MNRTTLLAGAILLTLVVVDATDVQAVPFSNGSFETNAGGTQTINSGGYITGSDGWQSVGAGARLYSATIGPPTDGVSHVALNLNNDPGGLRQTFDTVTDGIYRVLFDYAAIANTGSPLDYDLSYEIVGLIPPTTLTATTSGSQFNTDYTLDEEFNFIATGSSSTLQFLSLTGGYASYGPILDNVRVQYLGQFVPVPEPTTGLLLGLGGVLMLRTARRRRATKPSRKQPPRA